MLVKALLYITFVACYNIGLSVISYLNNRRTFGMTADFYSSNTVGYFHFFVKGQDIHVFVEIVSPLLIFVFLNVNNGVFKTTYTFNMVVVRMCYDYALATCLVYNEYQTDDVIASLQEGDTVLYGDKKKERYIFNGYTNLPSAPDITYVLLSQGGGNKTFVPQKRWGYIQPYFGASKRFDGRGLRKKVLFVKTFIMRCWSIRRRIFPPY